MNTALPATDNNPFAHLSFVSPHNARELMICTYIIIGSLSVFIWDILCHMRDDYHILSHRITSPTFVYFFSRLFTLLYLIAYTIIQTAPVGHCSFAIRLATFPVVFALPGSEFLLFLHVRAIYATNRTVTWFFTLLWLSTLVSAVIAVVSISGMSIGPTQYCTTTTLARVNIATIIIPLVNDTLLFIALVARVLDTSVYNVDTFRLRDRINSALFGLSVPQLAKTLLQNGQQYFIVTVSINLAALIVYYADGGNPSLGFPSVMLMNLMSSRLYRKTKLTPYGGVQLSIQQSYPLAPSQQIASVPPIPTPDQTIIAGSASGAPTCPGESVQKL